MKKLLLLLLISGCSSQALKVEVKPIEVKPVATPVVTAAKPPVVIINTNLATLDNLVAVANSSKCMTYSWKNRGVAPSSYIKGMALAYAHAVCFPNKVVASTTLGPADKDALTHYGLKADALNVYALLIGSGMRESSGKYCEGRDMSAHNVSASSAEAGMFQTSYNSHTASPELDVVFNDFKNNAHNCLNTFKENIPCSKANMAYYGTGDGLTFQKMAKECPAFAVEYAAVTFRTLYKHYGPLINKATEYKQECVDMLTAIEMTVKASPELCNLL